MKEAFVKSVMEDMLSEGDYDCNIDSVTSFVEDVGAELKCDYAGGPLDDESHWIWDVGIEVWNKHFNL